MAAFVTRFLSLRSHTVAATILDVSPAITTSFPRFLPGRVKHNPLDISYPQSSCFSRLFATRRNPKIKISLEQLRMAKRNQGRRGPICEEQHSKVLNALEAANYENGPIYKYILEYDKCREEYERVHKHKNKSTMTKLTRYLVRRRTK